MDNKFEIAEDELLNDMKIDKELDKVIYKIELLKSFMDYLQYEHNVDINFLHQEKIIEDFSNSDYNIGPTFYLNK